MLKEIGRTKPWNRTTVLACALVSAWLLPCIAGAAEPEAAFSWQRTDTAVALLHDGRVVWKHHHDKAVSKPHMKVCLLDGTELTRPWPQPEEGTKGSGVFSDEKAAQGQEKTPDPFDLLKGTQGCLQFPSPSPPSWTFRRTDPFTLSPGLYCGLGSTRGLKKSGRLPSQLTSETSSRLVEPSTQARTC